MSIDTAVLAIPEARTGPAPETRWYAAEVAGLPVLVRNLFLLKSLGVRTVHVSASEKELPGLREFLSTWRADRRLPRVETHGPAGMAPGVLPRLYLLADATHVFHPKLVEFALARQSRAAVVAEDGAPPAVGLLAEEDPPSPSALPALPRVAGPKGSFSRPARNGGERRDAERLVFRSLGRETDGWVASRLNRPLSLWISRRLVGTSIRPNGITLFNFLVGAGSGALAALGSSASVAAAGVLYQLASMLDGVDGEVARAKFLASRTGAWLDTACDEATNLMFLVGVIVGVQRQTPSRAFFWLGVATLGLYSLTLALLYGQLAFGLRRTSLLAFQEEIHKPEFRKRKASRLILLLQPLIKRDLYALLFMCLCLAGFPRLIVTLWLVAVVLTPVLFVREVLGSIGRDRA
jgi:phosphatidylglycerophosphate synthase